MNLSIITDVAWLSQTRLCVLGRAIDAGVTTPYEIVVDGSGATSMGQLTATSMAAVVALPTEMGTGRSCCVRTGRCCSTRRVSAGVRSFKVLTPLRSLLDPSAEAGRATKLMDREHTRIAGGSVSGGMLSRLYSAWNRNLSGVPGSRESGATGHP